MPSMFQIIRWLSGMAAILVSSGAIAAGCTPIDTKAAVQVLSSTISSTALHRGKLRTLKVYTASSGEASVVLGSGREACLRYQLRGVRKINQAVLNRKPCALEGVAAVEGVPSCTVSNEIRNNLRKLNNMQLIEGELVSGTGRAIQPRTRVQILLGFCSRPGASSYLCIETTRTMN